MPRVTKSATPKRTAARKNGSPVEPNALIPSPTHDEIARLAYELFERSGAEHGRDLQNWLDAERQLLSNSRQWADASRQSAVGSHQSPVASRQS